MKYGLAFVTIFLLSIFSFEAMADCKTSVPSCPSSCTFKSYCKVKAPSTCAGSSKRRTEWTYQCDSQKRWCLVSGSSFCSGRQESLFKPDKVQ